MVLDYIQSLQCTTTLSFLWLEKIVMHLGNILLTCTFWTAAILALPNPQERSFEGEENPSSRSNGPISPGAVLAGLSLLISGVTTVYFHGQNQRLRSEMEGLRRDMDPLRRQTGLMAVQLQRPSDDPTDPGRRASQALAEYLAENPEISACVASRLRIPDWV